MFDILKSIYQDDMPSQQIFCNLDDPERVEEKRIVTQLRAVQEEAAQALKSSIEALADQQAELGFYSGVRFGAKLMAELLEELS